MSDDNDITHGSANVFADLGFADPVLELARADLAIQMCRIIAERGWTQSQSAAVLGIDQPAVSKIVRGRLGEFAPERLIKFLNRLDQDVRIVIAPNRSTQRAASTSVVIDHHPEVDDDSPAARSAAPAGRWSS